MGCCIIFDAMRFYLICTIFTAMFYYPKVLVKSGEPQLEVSQLCLPNLGENRQAHGEDVARAEHQKQESQHGHRPSGTFPEKNKMKPTISYNHACSVVITPFWLLMEAVIHAFGGRHWRAELLSS